MLVDNLKYVKIMEEVGFDEPQSKALVKVWSSIVELNLATKDDILLVKKDFEIALLKLEVKLEGRFKEIDKRFNVLEVKFEKLESRLFAKLAGMQLGIAGLIIAAFKLFPNP